MQNNILLALTTATLATALLGCSSGSDIGAPPSPMTWDRSTAEVMCSKNIKTLLNDPDSYRFDSVDIGSTTGDQQQYGTATVYFRAKNGFGGYTRESADCKAYDKGGEVYYQVQLNQ